MPSFPKSERLCGRKQIERLFAKGRGFVCYPYSVRWLESSQPLNSQFPIQVLVTVSRHRFHKAVDRNRVKRITRECYRLHKERLQDSLSEVGSKPLLLSLSYIDNQLPDFHAISHKFDTLIERLKKEVADAKAGKDN